MKKGDLIRFTVGSMIRNNPLSIEGNFLRMKERNIVIKVTKSYESRDIGSEMLIHESFTHEILTN